MSNPGLGVMIQALGGRGRDVTPYIGAEIANASMDEERLRLQFKDGRKIMIVDGGQSCCESRYMRTDDDVQSLVGHKLLGLYEKEGLTEEGDYDCHEICFLEVQTDGGFITVANHNEHNGYYGGFYMQILEDKEAK